MLHITFYLSWVNSRLDPICLTDLLEIIINEDIKGPKPFYIFFGLEKGSWSNLITTEGEIYFDFPSRTRRIYKQVINHIENLDKSARKKSIIKVPRPERKHTVTAMLTEVQRATERLHGILAGISIDYKLRDIEIAELYGWLNMHEGLHHMEPFLSAAKLLNRCLEDQVIDEDEREEILEWCLDFTDNIHECVTVAVRRLHGVLHGIAIDGVITEAEVLGLQDWLRDYEVFKDHWPFYNVWELVGRILEDSKVTEVEKAELLDYCHQFTENVIDAPLIHDSIYSEPWMKSGAPVLQPFTDLCNRKAEIEFPKRSFCFTGLAKTGPRGELHGIVKSLYGIPCSNVIRNLDYLVIGAQSSPCWAYSTYGRKIEKVIEYRRKGDNIIILHEDDFITQARQYRPIP